MRVSKDKYEQKLKEWVNKYNRNQILEWCEIHTWKKEKGKKEKGKGVKRRKEGIKGKRKRKEEGGRLK